MSAFEYHPDAECVDCGEVVGENGADSNVGPLCGVCVDAYLAAGQGEVFETADSDDSYGEADDGEQDVEDGGV